MTEAEAMKAIREWAKVLGTGFYSKSKEGKQIEKQKNYSAM